MRIKFDYNERDFMSFADGADVNDKEIGHMIDRCVAGISDEERLYFEATGNAMVIAVGYGKDRVDEISVYVCKGYKEATAWIDNEGKWEKMDWSKDYEKELEGGNKILGKCPVCEGRGFVSGDFYLDGEDDVNAKTVCKSCGGKGYIEVS